jgi:DNA-binding LacI/PurR family transcriptional regulator
MLEDARVPYAMIGRTQDVETRPSVDIDFDTTVEQALDHLVAEGHTHIAFVNHSQAMIDAGYGPAVRAAAAFERMTGERGIAALNRACEDSPVVGRSVTADLLAADPDLTAIVTMNELATFGVYAELQSRNLVVGEDVSVLGIVSSPGVGTLSYPPLTTMHSPGTELGRLAVECLLSQLHPERGAVPNQLIPCVLEPGMSIGPARTRRDA